MKVYLVSFRGCGGCECEGFEELSKWVFSSEEKAKSFIKQQSYSYQYFIEELEVDEG